MGTLTYPHTLVPGVNENVQDVQDNFNALRTVVNGGIDATNLASSVKPATVLSGYRRVDAGMHNHVISLANSGTYIFNTLSEQMMLTNDASCRGAHSVFLTGTDLAVSGLTPNLRLAASVQTIGVAPGINFTFGLYPFTVAGAGTSVVVTLGAAVSGSTTVFTTPAINSSLSSLSSDFAVPADGVYCYAVTLSAQNAVNSTVTCSAQLYVHWT